MMLLASTAILFATVLQLIRCEISCPNDLTSIYPCICENGTQGLLIKCSYSNLAILSKSLKNLPSNVEKVEIEHSAVSKLFGVIFSDSKQYPFHETVRELDVRASGLSSIGPQSFSNELLTNLQYVQLDRNNLSRIPVDFLSNTTNLRLLNLSTNSIETIDNNSLVKLTNLTDLDVSFNKLKRLHKNAFSGLSLLESLSLKDNELAGQLEKNIFSDLKKLRHLDLSSNKLTTLDRQDLLELSALETLKVVNNQLATIARSIFTRNAQLYTLDLSFNKLDQIDTYLFKSTRFLKDLNMAGNKIKEITKNTFSPTKRIKRINLSHNQLQTITADTFKGLESLEYINLAHNLLVNISTNAFSNIFQVEVDLSYNQLKRIHYGAFHEVSNMTRLDLSHNSLNDGVSQFAFMETDCAHLDLSHNLFQDVSRFPVSNLTGLRSLDISHNQIVEFNKKSFSEKKPMYELHTIDASYNNLTKISGNIMERLRSIRLLNVSHNSLGNIASGAFGNSPTLLELDLSHNKIAEMASGSLLGLTSVRTLDLRFNKLKKMIPLPVALNVIHLEHNEIGRLNQAAFPSLNSLLELYLDFNSVSQIEETTFSTLLALNTLSISWNNLTQVPVQALKYLASLQTLNLNGNRIERLQRKAFGVLPIVFNLRLDQNNISSISDNAFEGMLQLLNLNLSYNSLIELPPEAFKSLVSLQTLDLSHNQLNKFENTTRSAMEDLLSLNVANFSDNKLSIITSKTFLNSQYIPCRLTKLDLSNNLIGILLNHFSGGLKKVEWLDLHGNIINEIMPNMLGNMTNLKHLDLSHNKLRTLKENTFPPGRLIDLQTILLNNNKLTRLQLQDFDNLKSLIKLNLASNRLESIFPELSRWIMARSIIVDLQQNNLECNCEQLPLLAWIESFKSRSRSYSLALERAKTRSSEWNQLQNVDHLIRNRLTRKLLEQYEQASQLVSNINCSKPSSMNGKSIMQMLKIAYSEPSSSLSTSKVSSLVDLNCDNEILSKANNIKRLECPIQFSGTQTHYENGAQHLRIGWTLLDPSLNLINFLVLRAKFKQPIELGSFRAPENLATLKKTSMELAQTVSSAANKDSNNDLQPVEFDVYQVPYNEQTLVLRNLDPEQAHIVCVGYQAGNQQSHPMEQLNKTTSANEQSALIGLIVSNYGEINCVNLSALLQRED